MRTIRNQQDREGLIRRLQTLTGREQALWGRMTVDQMMSHLVQAGDLPFAASLPDRSSFFSRAFTKYLVLYVIPMPREVKTPPDLDQQANGRKPAGFGTDRELVIGLTEKLAALSSDHDCQYHPFFGKMSAKEWAIIAYKHIDHHLKQFGV